MACLDGPYPRLRARITFIEAMANYSPDQLALETLLDSDEDELEVFGQEVIDFARAGGEDQSDAETTDEEPAVTTQEDAETTDEETASPTQEVVEDTAEDTAEDAVEDAPADEGEPSATPGEESPS